MNRNRVEYSELNQNINHDGLYETLTPSSMNKIFSNLNND